MKVLTNQALISQTTQLDELMNINVTDMLESFGFTNHDQGRRAMETIFKIPARRFAQQMIIFDHKVGEQGLHSASDDILKKYVNRLDVEGLANIPESGPVLVLSNHPGMTDTLVLFSSLPRADLRIVTGEHPFFRSLYNTSPYLIYVSDEPRKRMNVVRSTVNHLRKGGLVLTFPAGQIEPDPSCMPGGIASLDSWSESIAVFARLVPELRIVTAIVSGVIWPKAMYHPLTRLRRKPRDRERFGAALQGVVQTILPFYRPVNPRVIYGEPLLASDFLSDRSPNSIMRAVTTQARTLIERGETSTYLE